MELDGFLLPWGASLRQMPARFREELLLGTQESCGLHFQWLPSMSP